MRLTPGWAGPAPPARLPSLLLLLLSGVLSTATARQGEAPPHRRFESALLIPPATLSLTLPADVAGGAAARRPSGRPPAQFAHPLDVAVTPADAGIWQTLPDGGRLWRLRIRVPGATDLNFTFENYRPAPGVQLYFTGELGRRGSGRYEGPYHAGDRQPGGRLWTPVLRGDSALLELYLPPGRTGWGELTLARVNAGFRDAFGAGGSRQGDCNNDVICAVGDPWREQIRSVAKFTYAGLYTCSGFLLMDAEATFTPFLLTAHHCDVSAEEAASMVIYWNFESPACGRLGDGSLADNQTGATLLAAEPDVDMRLLLLDDRPEEAFGVYYAGWDRSDIGPVGSVGIHHPAGAEKAISFNDDEVLSGERCFGFVERDDTHWIVDDWESGTTEVGSSGSPLFDPVSKRAIGILSGGSAACGFLAEDCYGKFSLAWGDGDSAATRLRDWLDPNGLDLRAVDGGDPADPVEKPPLIVEDGFEAAAAGGPARFPNR